MADFPALAPDAVLDILLAAERPLILTHAKPDGDTVGSAAALAHLFAALGKKAAILFADPLPRRLAFLLDGLSLADEEENAGGTVIAVDVASPTQLGSLRTRYEGSVALAIDHHATGTPFAPYFVESDAAACGEILYMLAQAIIPSGKLTSRLSDGFDAAVYAAISSDTGCFRFANTTDKTHMTAARLLRHGVDAAAINRALFFSRTEKDLAADAVVLRGLSLHEGGRIAVVSLPLAVREGIPDEHFETAIDIARSLAGVEIAASLRELADGTTKLSLRSNDADVSEICRRHGGGGHIRAAGATLTGTPEALLPALLAELTAALPS